MHVPSWMTETLLGWLAAAPFLPSRQYGQTPLKDFGRHRTNLYNVTLNFDDLPTSSHGLGYHPFPRDPALPYKTVYLEGVSIIDVNRFPSLHPDDLACASSAPNAIFGHVTNTSLAWPRISLNDLSKPAREHATSMTSRTFFLAEISLKPAGELPQNATVIDGIVGILITLLKLPTLDGHDQSDVDGFPELFWGQPITVPLTTAMVGVSFALGHTDKAYKLALREWLGKDWGTGMDVMEIRAQLVMFGDEPNEYDISDVEFCADDVVMNVVEEADGSKSGKEADTELGLQDEALKRCTMLVTLTSDGKKATGVEKAALEHIMLPLIEKGDCV